MCGKHKPKSQFYKSSDPLIKSGITHICKKCAYNIACRVYETGEAQEPTKASVMMALEYIDKPFLRRKPLINELIRLKYIKVDDEQLFFTIVCLVS